MGLMTPYRQKMGFKGADILWREPQRLLLEDQDRIRVGGLPPGSHLPQISHFWQWHFRHRAEGRYFWRRLDQCV